MAAETRVYGVGRVAFMWGNLDLMTGVADGSEIRIEDTVPEKWSQHDIGVAGAASVQTHHPSRSGTVAIDIDMSSKLYQKLMQIQEADSITYNQVATGHMKDESTGESETLSGMRLANRPPRVKGFDRSVASFMWIFTRSDYVPGPDDENQIGVGIDAADPLGSTGS